MCTHHSTVENSNSSFLIVNIRAEMFSLYFTVLATINAICAAGPAVIPVNSILVPVENLSPKPYEFGYEFADSLGMFQHRRETSDNIGTVKGSYGYMDPSGQQRRVDYVADGQGYRASVHSNEVGLSSQSSADALFFVQPPPPAAVAQGL